MPKKKYTGHFKKYFLPGRHNNFKPKVLHPHRLAFHAVAAIVMKVIIVGVLLVLPSEAYLAPGLMAEQSQKIIQLTNDLRSKLGLNELKESPLLAQAALGRSSDMLAQGYFSHYGPQGQDAEDFLKKINYNYSLVGENLAIDFKAADEIMLGWEKSPSHYSNLIDKNFKEIGIGITSGFYQDRNTTIVTQLLANPEINNLNSATEKSQAKINLSVIEPSVLNHYLFLKSNQNQEISRLFNLSDFYYQLILAIIIFALTLNILVKIRKQHGGVILSSLGLIYLLVVLLIF